MTYGLTRRLNIGQLESLRIANSSLENIEVCNTRKTHQHKHDNELITCDDLKYLHTLDLRNNNLTGLSEFKLTALLHLYLSGKLD